MESGEGRGYTRRRCEADRQWAELLASTPTEARGEFATAPLPPDVQAGLAAIVFEALDLGIGGR